MDGDYAGDWCRVASGGVVIDFAAEEGIVVNMGTEIAAGEYEKRG